MRYIHTLTTEPKVPDASLLSSKNSSWLTICESSLYWMWSQSKYAARYLISEDIHIGNPDFLGLRLLLLRRVATLKRTIRQIGLGGLPGPGQEIFFYRTVQKYKFLKLILCK